MTTNILAVAVALSDADLLSRIDALVSRERETSAELVAHLAALEMRPSLYAAQGYGSLFAYCTLALRLSEDAASNRIAVARICLRFPAVLELLATGGLTLSSIRMLGPHLTAENHERVLARAFNRRCEEIKALVAELAPQPDVVASVRKLPVPRSDRDHPAQLMPQAATTSIATPAGATLPLLELSRGTTPSAVATAMATSTPEGQAAASSGEEGVESSAACTSPLGASLAAPGQRAHRPIVQALAPGRYRVQFTIGQEAYHQLRRVQDLLRREIPNGDAGRIFERALRLLHDHVERAKLGGRPRPRSKGVIRRAADNGARLDRQESFAGDPGRRAAPRGTPSRHIPNAVKRTVWWRDRGQCAFVSAAGHRCTERSFLELHHIQPHALDGPATAGNISLRCRRHNRYEAELVFGPDVVNRRHAIDTARTPATSRDSTSATEGEG